MDYSVEQEFKKVWGSLRCKANCNSTFWELSGLNIVNKNSATGGVIVSDTSDSLSDVSIEVTKTGIDGVPSVLMIGQNKAKTEMAYFDIQAFDPDYLAVMNWENAAGDKNSIKVDNTGIVIDTWTAGVRNARFQTTTTGFSFQGGTPQIPLFTIDLAGQLNITSVPSYADDAAAITGGLGSGDIYQTTTGGSTFLKRVP